MGTRPKGSAGGRRRALGTAAGIGVLTLAMALAATRVGGQLRGEDETRPPVRLPAAQPRAGSALDSDEPVPPARPPRRPARQARQRGDWDEPVRREPAPIPRARPLPHYPAEPPPYAPPSFAALGPPDFVGSAAGYLEIPVGQTATLMARDSCEAVPRQPKIARVVAHEPDRVLIRGLFPGRTLLDVRYLDRDAVYIVQVR